MRKKVISFLLICALTAALVPAAYTEALAWDSPLSAPVSALAPEAAGAYASVIRSTYMEYGLPYYPNDVIPEGFAENEGLCYADLMDFEGDGTPELFLYYKSWNWLMEEIWRWDGNSAVRTDEIKLNEPEFHNEKNMYGTTFIKKDGRIWLVDVCTDGGGGGILQELEIYGYSGGGLEMSTYVSEFWEPWDAETYNYEVRIDYETVYSQIVPSPESTPEVREVKDFYARWPKSDWVELVSVDYESFSFRCNDVLALEDQLLARRDEGAIAGIDPSDPLASVGYNGDRTACRMDAKMALAYAEALDGEDFSHTALIDLNGWPVMFSSDPFPDLYSDNAWYDVTVREYQEEKAVFSRFISPSDGFIGEFAVCDSPVGQVLMGGVIKNGVYSPVNGAKYYTCEGGRLKLWHTVTTDSGDQPYGNDTDVSWYLDGEYFGRSDPAGALGITVEYTVFSYAILGQYPGDIHFASTRVTAAALRLYAETVSHPTYGYPDVAENGDEYSEQVKKAVLDETGGEILSVYRLSEGTYYVLVDNGGTVTAVLVRGVRVNGDIRWILERRDAPEDPEDVDAQARRALSESNMEVDFEDLKDISDAQELLAYIGDKLDNMDGISPNDPAKTDLSRFVEAAISRLASGSVNSSDGRLTLDGSAAGALASSAADTLRRVDEMLEGRGVKLNRELSLVTRILWADADLTEPLLVTFDSSLAGALEGGSVMLMLSDGSRYISVDGTALERAFAGHGGLAVRLSVSGSVCSVAFLDGEGGVLERLPAPVTLGLPAAGETDTVMASFLGGSENWGAQYDRQAGVLIFDTPYSGDYEVIGNPVEITDIDGLDGETGAAVRFMVSKGFFSAADGRFDPDGVLKRYHFTKVLVGMFFALDRDAASTFTDVPADSLYYAYVASGQSAGLVRGVSETEFGGDQVLTVEQMLTLTGRTLQDQRGYLPPDAPEMYLAAFDDADLTADWARVHTALSIREGLVDPGGELSPKAGVTRAQAALILYRLFLRLHTVSPVKLPMPEATEPTPAPGGTETGSQPTEEGAPEAPVQPPEDVEHGGTMKYVVIALAALVVILIAVIIVLLSKRRRNSPAAPAAAAAPATPEKPAAPQPRRCPGCGNELPATAKFCPKCGTRL